MLGNYSLFHKKLIHSGLSKNFKKKTKNLSNPSTVKRCACSCCLKVNKHWRHLPIASHTTKQSLLFFVYFIFLVTPPYPPRVCSLGAEHLLMKEIRLRKKQLIILQNRYKHFLFTEKSLIYKKQKWKLMQCTTKEWPGVKMFYSLFINNPPIQFFFNSV